MRAAHCVVRTKFAQYGFGLDRADLAPLDHHARDFIRDLPYLQRAFYSQVLVAKDDATMPEFEMPIDEQIKLLAREFKTFGTKLDSIDTRLTSVDTRLTSVETKLTSVDTRLTSVETKLTSVDTRLTSVETKLTSVDTRLTSVETELTSVGDKLEQTHALATETHVLATRTQVLLERTHAVAKLGLEGVEGLQQSTDAKFAAAAKHNAEQTELLKALFVHVRKRVERIEPTKRRRRP